MIEIIMGRGGERKTRKMENLKHDITWHQYAKLGVHLIEEITG